MDTRGDRQPGQGHPTSESTWAAAQTQRLYLQSHIILPKMLQQLKLLNADFSGITQIFVKVNSERKWLVIHPSFSVPIIRLSCGFLLLSCKCLHIFLIYMLPPLPHPHSLLQKLQHPQNSTQNMLSPKSPLMGLCYILQTPLSPPPASCLHIIWQHRLIPSYSNNCFSLSAWYFILGVGKLWPTGQI